MKTKMPIIVKRSKLLFVVEGDVGEELPPLAIDGIREPGMVGVKLVSVRQNLTKNKKNSLKVKNWTVMSIRKTYCSIESPAVLHLLVTFFICILKGFDF
jgi:hypothetical protein